jgi:Tol biopolymer transport system component
MYLMRLRATLVSGLAIVLAAALPASADVNLVSVNQSGADSASGSSEAWSLSPSGRFVVFATTAGDLGPTDTNGLSDVYLRDLLTGTVTLVSANTAGTNGGNGPSTHLAVISADERFVAFYSMATDLTTLPDSNAGFDAFVWERATGTTTLVSVNASGIAAGNAPSVGLPSLDISADGSKIVFETNASDLGPNDTNEQPDVYVRDRVGGSTALASVNSSGTDSGDGNSGSLARISANGQVVVFSSGAEDLVPNDSNTEIDAFARNLTLGATTLVSVNTAGTNGGDAISGLPTVSADGRYVVFISQATDLTPLADTNTNYDVFRRDLQTSTTSLISVNASGTSSGDGVSANSGISTDGRYVLLVSIASDLGPVDTNGTADVYLRDLQAGTLELISVNSAGADAGNSASGRARLSSDGRFVVFESLATNLAAPDTNSFTDVYLRDVDAGTTRLISVNDAGTNGGNGHSFGSTPFVGAVLSDDGRIVVFTSGASDLVGTDTNGSNDVFVSGEFAPAGTLHLSSSATVSAGGVTLQNEDVARFDASTQQYTRIFDGSDVGLALTDVDGLEILPDGDLLLSLQEPTFVPGLGLVENEDVVRFTPGPGPQTSGSFSLFFNGDAHGIFGLGKNLDAIAYEETDGVLLFSTSGTVLVDGIQAQNEDVVALDLATNDAELIFDGSAFGLQLANLDGFEVNADGTLLLSFGGTVSLPGLGNVPDEDVVRFAPDPLNPARSGSFSPYFDGSANDFEGNLFNEADVDAISLGQ